jgi:putative sigma-54 modulation protein
MNISITFRHMESSDAIKRHASQKLAKLQRFLRQPMTAKVTLSLDKLAHVAETRISSGGAHLEAKEASDDMYTSIDRVMTKLERQIRGAKGATQSRQRRGGDTVRGAEQPATERARLASPAKASKKAAASRSKREAAKIAPSRGRTKKNVKR